MSQMTFDSHTQGVVCRQLLEIQREVEAINTSRSRLGVLNAQRNLAMWDRLKVKLDETIEVNMASRLERCLYRS